MDNKEITLKIVGLIKTGIVDDNGQVRKFDTLDYYNLTSMTPNEFLSNVVSLGYYGHIGLAKRFAINNLIGTDLEASQIEYLLNDFVEVDVQQDEKGRFVTGTGRVISKTEKIGVMDYMRDRNIPLNRSTFASIFNRYKQGIPFEQTAKVGKLEK